MKSLSISKQLLVVSSIALTGFTVIGGIYNYGTNQVAHYQHQQSTANNTLTLAGMAHNSLSQMRMAQRSFQILPTEAKAETFADSADRLETNLEALNALLENSPDEQSIQAVHQATELAITYHAGFDKLNQNWDIIGQTETEGLRGKLRSAVHKVEAAVRQYDDKNLLSMMLMMRRHEKDFIIRLNPKYQDKMAKQLAIFNERLTYDLALSVDEKDILLDYMDVYQTSFNQLVDTRLATEAGLSELDKTYEALEPLMVQLSDNAAHAFDQAKRASANMQDTIQLYMLLTLAITAFACFAISIFVGRLISNPIEALTRCMNDLSKGKLDAAIPALDFKNEVGAVAHGVAFFRDTIVKSQEEEANRIAKEQAVQEEQRQKIMSELADMFGQNISGVLKSVTDSATGMQATAEEMNAAAKETSHSTSTITEATDTAHSNVQEVSTSADYLFRALTDMERDVDRSTNSISDAVSRADVAAATITELDQAAGAIGEIVKLINDIAEQTNLLALNATIEAARAGEAGKGFAVVAHEVKNLATQTQKATGDINQQIQAVQQGTQSAVSAIEAVTHTIEDVRTISGTIVEAMETQREATTRITQNVDQAQNNTEQVSNQVDHVKQNASQTEIAANNVNKAAADLSVQSKKMNDFVSDFLNRIRAA